MTMKTATNRGPSKTPVLSRLSRYVGAGGSEAGQSLVEFALALPLLLVLVLGAIDLGRLVYMSVGVTNAAHAGAQYGCQNPAAAGDVTGIQTAAANDAADLVGVGNGSLTTTSTSYCQCSDGSSANSSCSMPTGVHRNAPGGIRQCEHNRKLHALVSLSGRAFVGNAARQRRNAGRTIEALMQSSMHPGACRQLSTGFAGRRATKGGVR
jgi:hypothetical protein